MRARIIYILFIIAGVTGCIKPYNPATSLTNINLLVVEGMINAGTDSTIITLSRTVLVSGKTTVNPEINAVITIENAQGALYTLTQIAKGTYAYPKFPLDETKQYRLRIKTTNGKVYLSSLVDVKLSPPIDSVGYSFVRGGMQIYANTHDPNNNTHYYRYTYRETWQFSSRYSTYYISDGKTLNTRTPAQQVHNCFGSDTSAHTIINSTAALTEDVGFQVPITTIDESSEKLETKYSILVTQQALTKDGYAFYQDLKKNTEQLGSIFDALPSQLVGNIHNIADPSEPVIGFITAGTVNKKRIFISKAALPSNFDAVYPYYCTIDSAWFGNPGPAKYPYPTIPLVRKHTYYVLDTLVLLPVNGLAIDPFYIEDPWKEFGYTFTIPVCADCSLRGTTKPPAYWK